MKDSVVMKEEAKTNTMRISKWESDKSICVGWCIECVFEIDTKRGVAACVREQMRKWTGG